MPRRSRPRDSFAHVSPPRLPEPSVIWQLREDGTPVFEIARRYEVSKKAVYNALARYRIKHGLKSPPVMTLRRYLETKGEIDGQTTR